MFLFLLLSLCMIISIVKNIYLINTLIKLRHISLSISVDTDVEYDDNNKQNKVILNENK